MLANRQFWAACKSLSGSIAALHIGSTGIGLAVSDDYKISAVPLCTFKRDTGWLEIDAKKLVDIITARSILGIVFGLTETEEEYDQKEFISSFCQQACLQQSNLHYTTWCEAFSSEIAQDVFGNGRDVLIRLFGKKERPKKRLAMQEHFAAAVILNEFLGSMQC